jgi:protocatechuate 3,4-dioxygenase beta subunit
VLILNCIFCFFRRRKGFYTSIPFYYTNLQKRGTQKNMAIRKHNILVLLTIAIFTMSIASIAFAGPGPAKLPGAIFTTTPDGGVVNENVHYNAKIEVYLDGGPSQNAPSTAAGLPAGIYVYQVTDPSGHVLLSEDPSKCRLVEVNELGVIARQVPPSELGYGDDYFPKSPKKPVSCHIADAPTPPYDTNVLTGVAGPSAQHDTNMDVDHGNDAGAIVVQLMPFLDTPNPGGVYKAWMQPIEHYLTSEGDLEILPKKRGSVKRKGQFQGYKPDSAFGPSRHEIKTDNFKVVDLDDPEPPGPSAMLHVLKFHDLNANGVHDSGEPSIGVDQCVNNLGELTDCTTGGGWPVSITDPLLITNDYFTPVWIIAEPTGIYTVTEGTLPLWHQSALYVDGIAQTLGATATVDVLPEQEHEVLYGNYLLASLSGTKYIDTNGNGVQDDGEGCPAAPDVNNPGCEGIMVTLTGTDGTGSAVSLSTTTDANGDYSFTGLVPGQYSVSVVEPNGFACSAPSPCQYDLALTSGQASTGNDFGDYGFAELHGIKWDDLNANGQHDLGEPGLAGVTITLTGLNGKGQIVSLSTTSDANGEFWFTELAPGTYHVTETLPAGLEASTPLTSGPHVLASSQVLQLGYVFGNYKPAEVHGTKFIDLNGNGVQDFGEGCPAAPDANNPGCEGITVTLTGTDGKGQAVSLTTTTDANGDYSFTGITPGQYTIALFEPTGFVCSSPSPCEYQLDLQSGDVSYGNDFGDIKPVDIHAHKWFDFDGDGVQDAAEEDLAGIKFCLTQDGAPVTQDAYGNALASCQISNDAGLVWWMSLEPGTYTVTEDLAGSPLQGVFPTTATSATFTLVSGQAAVTAEFGNDGACNGLTPGYWKNWRNHYTYEQMEQLIQGTFVSSVEELDEVFDQWSAADPQDYTILKAMLLANQLNLELTQTDLPNPSDGSLFGACLLTGSEELGSLGDAVATALDMLANPGTYTDVEILAIKDILDAFANQFTGQ